MYLWRGAETVIRLGRISYVNMAPVFHRLNADVEEVSGVPVELSRKLLAGEVDVETLGVGQHHAGALKADQEVSDVVGIHIGVIVEIAGNGRRDGDVVGARLRIG